MRALIQRVSRAEVDVEGTTIGEIGGGLCAFVGVTHEDSEAEAEKLATKIAGLRVFDDDQGVMNLSLLDTGQQALVVSQFTLYADTRKGRRPSYVAAARPESAEPLVDAVVAHLEALGVEVATGKFRAEMMVSLCNDGPVTIMIEV